MLPYVKGHPSHTPIYQIPDFSSMAQKSPASEEVGRETGLVLSHEANQLDDIQGDEECESSRSRPSDFTWPFQLNSDRQRVQCESGRWFQRHIRVAGQPPVAATRPGWRPGFPRNSRRSPRSSRQCRPRANRYDPSLSRLSRVYPPVRVELSIARLVGRSARWCPPRLTKGLMFR